MLIKQHQSCLLLIDVQEKLSPYVLDASALIKRCDWLLQLAEVVKVPILASEQYPKGLGGTVKPLAQRVSHKQLTSKVHFSCAKEPSFINQWQQLQKQQVIIAGIETHVCVLQTALDLLSIGIEVFVVVDATSSRHAIDYRYGLKRMKQAGVQLVTAEMVFFEWLEKAGTQTFKTLSKQFLR